LEIPSLEIVMECILTTLVSSLKLRGQEVSGLVRGC
jgi:hypothetical protein